jgi:phosphatidylserine/phosphatidylglycerophosphate/cardiolipin synthase-like enzyme
MSPNPTLRQTTVLATTLLLALLLVTAVGLTLAHSGGSPAWYFTDNLDATGPGEEITEMEQALLDRLNGAAGSIDAAIYDFNRNSVRDALLDAHGRGVTVRVVTDDDARNHSTYSLYYDALEAAGIPVIDDQRPGSLMHNKFFVFDEEIVWTGSTNLTNNGFTVNHNNSLVLTSTLLADIYGLEFQQMFAGSFSNAKNPTLTTTLNYNGRPLQVYFSPQDNAIDALIDEVDAAQESIHFSIFFFTSADLANAMIERQQAGVTIEGVWDLLGAASPFSQDESLCAAGIPIKIEDYFGFMHNKFMVIDAHGPSPRLITGSMNWTGAGNNSNDENSLILHDEATAVAYYDAFRVLYDTLSDDRLCDYTVEQPYQVWLPLIVKPPGSPPPPDPIEGDNVVCQETGQTQLCAWVSNGTPPRFSTVTVYGRLLVGGSGQAGQVMETTWHYLTTTSYCDGLTGSDGVAHCSRSIGGATAGFQVNIEVEIEGQTVTTWFVPE